MSRELDEEVATRVMGWGYRTFPDGVLPHVKHWYPPGQEKEYGFPLPHYSTSISNAWLVVEEMRKLAVANDLELTMNLNFGIDEKIWCDFFAEASIARGCGDTAPEAICAAALEAVK